MSTVPVVVHGNRVAVGKVPSVHVVDIAIAIVVEVITGNFTRIFPCVGGEIGVIKINAGVDDGNNDAA